MRQIFKKICIHNYQKFKVGNKVRINKTKRTFDKGYLPKWTREIFEITHVNKTFSPITYKIKELQGEQILGTYYKHELQLIKDDGIYEIDSVLINEQDVRVKK